MKAGFALAALLLDDRALAQVAPALPPELLAALRDELARAQGSGADVRGAHDPAFAPGSAHADDARVAALLRVLQPELTPAGVNQLPPRMRSLLARLLPPATRKALFADALHSQEVGAQQLAARADFVLDEQLLRVLVRLARRQAAPVPA